MAGLLVVAGDASKCVRVLLSLCAGSRESKALINTL